jgi:hypothetical protein
MTEPNAQQMERLREIAQKTALVNAVKTNAASISQRWMFDEYINEQSIAILESLLTVWREAQGEIANSGRDWTRHALIEEKRQLEASLRLAVEALDRCNEDINSNIIRGYTIQSTRETLSTIRANHPNIFVPTVGTGNTEKP